MKKELLIRHIEGDTTLQEQQLVEEWIGKSDANRQYYKNLKNVWVAQSLPLERMPQVEVISMVEELRKRKAPGNDLKFKRYFRIAVSVAAVAVIALAVMVWKYEAGCRDLNEQRVLLCGIPSGYKHTLYTENGIKAKVTLPDSSQVWLNSGSEIVYPDKFLGPTREIEFRGEAYFKVKEDSLRPMIIHTNKDFVIEVLGTEFNVKSYDDDKTAQTTLYSGKIKLVAKGDKNRKERRTEMKPFETCVVENNKILQVAPVTGRVAEDKKAWKEGRLIFTSAPMSEVVKVLRRWHGIEIEVEDPKILNYKITADFKSESMIQIAQILKFCALIDYRVENDKIIFFGR